MNQYGINIKEAKSFKERLIGLMFKKKTNYGLLFKKCKSIHTFFMLMRIDVIFLDKDDNEIKRINNVKPNKIIIGTKETKSIIEIPTKK